ncbi:response regulator [Cryomorpha ignava]|uniref:Response regulator n=1 Tax=Cryomorpha ignava TaxID=101383 RepID=A0A7K3WXR8_9FLAO|nr:response regulator [Cryomorpha ignava]NEN25662.1 response regulator [Cryomorpha ignava]
MKKLRHLKAYIVDDDEVELYVIQRIIYLKRLAEKVEVYRSGNELIEALQRTIEPPDYILINYRMSGENGLEILEKIQDLNLNKPESPPFFILTSSTADLSDLDAIMSDKNIDGFLYKPLIAKKLKEQLKSLFS